MLTSIPGGHVVKKLSAYCNGELTEAQARRVAEHLLKCQRCRREYDLVHFGVRLAEQLPDIAAPGQLWGEIEALLDAQVPHRRARSAKDRRSFNPRRLFTPV